MIIALGIAILYIKIPDTFWGIKNFFLEEWGLIVGLVMVLFMLFLFKFALLYRIRRKWN